MSVLSTLQTILRADVDVTALVGTQIYYNQAPQNTPGSYIVLNIITERGYHSTEGWQELVRSRVNVWIYGDTYPDMDKVRKAVQQALLVKSNSLRQVYYDNKIEQPYDEELKKYSMILEFGVWFDE